MEENNDQSPKLLDRVRQTCRRRQYSLHTDRAYTRWVERYVRFHDTTHPRHLDEDDIRSFLTHLASERNVAGSTQNQALNALVFLYDEELDEPLEEIGTIERPHRPSALGVNLPDARIAVFGELLNRVQDDPPVLGSLIGGPPPVC